MPTITHTLEIAFDSSWRSGLIANPQAGKDETYCWGFTQQIDDGIEQPSHYSLKCGQNSGDTHLFRLRIGDTSLSTQAKLSNLWIVFTPKKGSTTQAGTTPFGTTSLPISSPIIIDIAHPQPASTKNQNLLTTNQPANSWIIDGGPDITQPWPITNLGNWEFSVWFFIQTLDNSSSPIGRVFKVDPEVDVLGE